MLIDLHAHTGAISKCCLEDAETIIKTAKKSGFDGLAITNHYTSDYYDDSLYEEWIEKYIMEWEKCRMLGDRHGIRIFCGVEVTMDIVDPKLHMLIYGTDEAFLRNHPKLCEKKLEELYGLCKQYNCALVQAHPFRNGTTIQDTRYLDGLEVNCHPKYHNSYYEKILSEAKEQCMAVIVGCDYHADTKYRPLGGTIIPDTIQDDEELAKYILTSKEFELRIHEPSDESLFCKQYYR